jgi:flagellum-specific peptidoglycan hydrolase FlgJ
MTREQFIQQYSDLAIESTTGTPLFPSVLMAQAILESGGGSSWLAQNKNNFFGVTCGSWPKENCYKSDSGMSWRVYQSPKDSFQDYVKVLMKGYTFADHSSPENFLKSIEKTYAGSSGNYSSLALSIIRKYDLEKLDRRKQKKQALRVFFTVVGLVCAGLLALWAFKQ